MEKQDQNCSVDKSQISKDLLYSEKFHDSSNDSPFLLKKTKCNKQPQIFKVPDSSVLKNVQMFLPKLQAANNELDEKLKVMPASAVDIEHIEDTDGPLIQMDLAVIPHDESSEESESDGDSANSTTSDSESETEDIKTDINLPGEGDKKRKSIIEVLNNDSADDSENT